MSTITVGQENTDDIAHPFTTGSRSPISSSQPIGGTSNP
jgi:hypothetical protein